jgi:hypothetical protein
MFNQLRSALGRDREASSGAGKMSDVEQVKVAPSKVEEDEMEQKPLVEVAFSRDEEGRKFNALWEGRKGIRQSEMARNSEIEIYSEEGVQLMSDVKALSNDEDKWGLIERSLRQRHASEMAFMDHFIDVYDTAGTSSVYSGTQNINTARESLTSKEVRAIEPDNCYDCLGHPSEMVLEFATQLNSAFLWDPTAEVSMEDTLLGTNYKFQFYSTVERTGSKYVSLGITDEPVLSEELVKRVESFHQRRLLDLLKVMSLVVRILLYYCSFFFHFCLNVSLSLLPIYYCLPAFSDTT